MKIVFFGTSSFSVTILEDLLKTSHQVIGVVTAVDKPQGRSLRISSSPVKEWVLQFAPEIPLYQPEKASSDEFVSIMKNLEADVFIVAEIGRAHV